MINSFRFLGRRNPIYIALMMCGFFSQHLYAAQADLANIPLYKEATATAVKPNIALMVDDSGSMDWNYMPDSISGNSGSRCYGYYLFNTMAYNPNYIYTPPYKVDGTPYTDGITRYPDAIFSAVRDNGYTASGTLVDLTNSRPFSSGGTAYYYSTLNSGSSTSCLYYTNYTLVSNSSSIKANGYADGSEEAKRNYANWYTYYRKRHYTMKWAVAEAIYSLTEDKHRVGLFFINNAGYTKIADFGSTQRTAIFNRLYTTNTNGNTPLPGALSRMGRMYAGKFSSYDPVQYSCQRNYTILTSDGGWNVDGGADLNGSSVGNQDATAERPYRDVNNSSNSLADVAFYYYNTDLRTTALANCSNTISGTLYSGLCENNLKPGTKDTAKHQHMVTYTLGLGVDGTLDYVDAGYENKENKLGDYQFILSGTKNWPHPGTTTFTGGTKIDDLWHAAVNGRGIYYRADDPKSLANGLKSALNSISATSGAGSSYSITSYNLSDGSNGYKPGYTTGDWTGNIEACIIIPETGLCNTGAALWEAKTTLDGQTSASSDTRKIMYFNASSAGKLKSFTYENLNTDGLGASFVNTCDATLPILSQCSATSTFDKDKRTLANSGENMVNYLRGQRQYETNPIYRKREHVLGDIIGSTPIYLAEPTLQYGLKDSTYSAFITANNSRSPTLYVGANDGMLHAFNTETGSERWAFVPTSVIPNMYKLADADYSVNHRFYVDATPVITDVCTDANASAPYACKDTSKWKTILVGGLNKGGCGYYALDITDPATPKALWEFTDDNMGYTYGNPVVTKNKAGKWVVMVTSGYNNVPGGCTATKGDGKGYLYVLDAIDGTLIKKISTGIGSTTTPSNLGKLAAWMDDKTTNLGAVAYAGDMQGNLWRLNFDDNYPGGDAVLLASLMAGGTPQPLTTRPILAEVKDANGKKYHQIIVATGRMLGLTDIPSTTQQTIYGLKDDLTASPGLGVARSNVSVIKRTLIDTADGYYIEKGTQLKWDVHKGWYVDLHDKERVVVDPALWSSTLVVGSEIPNNEVCNSGAKSNAYYLNINSGLGAMTGTDSNNTLAGEYVGGSGIAGIAITSAGPVLTLKDGTLVKVKELNKPSSGQAKRVMWREIIE